MGKVSPKALIRAVFYVLGVIALSGCIMEPVNLTGFVEDDDVIDIIDKSAGTVNISNDSDHNLTAGNGKISGLDPNKYYTVEEWDQNGSLKGLQFVSSSGKRDANLTGIGRVSGREITGLTNSYHYRVKSAELLTGTVPYTNLAGLLGGNTSKQNAAIIEGAITLKPPDGGYLVFTPPPSAPINNYDINNCDIVKAPVTPVGTTTSVSLLSGDIFTEAPAETEADYVFYDRVIEALYVLKVVILDENTEPPVPPEPEITIKVTLSYTGDNLPVIYSASYTYSQIDDSTETFSVTNAGEYTGITWYIDGTQVETGESFILKKSEIMYKIIGVYTITVEAVKGGMSYSTAIQVTVSQ